MSRTDSKTHREPLLLYTCGTLGIIGSLAPTVTMVWGGLISEHDFMADTVSDLGRGAHGVIMDTGFFINAAAMLGLALGAANLHGGQRHWTGAILCLSLLALNIVAIGLWDAFGRTAEGDGRSVHTWLTFGLAPLYLLGPLLMAPVVRGGHPRLAAAFVLSAVLWIILAAVFKLSPDGVDGFFEKLAVAATLIWTLPLSWWMLRQIDG